MDKMSRAERKAERDAHVVKMAAIHAANAAIVATMREAYTEEQAREIIAAMRCDDREKAALLEQWIANAPGARFAVHAMAKRIGKAR